MNRDKNISKHLIKTLAKVLIVSAWFAVFSCQKSTQGSTADAAQAEEQIEQLREQGEQARKNSRFDQAIKLHNEELKLAEEVGDTISMVKALNNIGTNYRRLGILDDALQYHHKALILSMKSGDQEDETVKKNRLMSLNGLGNIYLTLGDMALADSIFRLALAGEKSLGSILGQAINLANIGSVKEQTGETDSAWIYYRHSLALNKQAQSKLGEALCFSHFANLHEKEGKNQEAIEEYKHAYDVMNDSPDDWHKLKAGINVAKLYIQQGDYQKAEEFLRQVNATAHRIHSLEHRSNIHHLYYQLYEKKGDIRAALTNYKLSTELKDSLMGTKNVDEIQTMRINLEREQQQELLKQANERYENERMALRVTSVILIITLIVAAVAIATLRRKLRKISKRPNN